MTLDRLEEANRFRQNQNVKKKEMSGVFDITFVLFIAGIALYAFVGLCWACAYDQEAAPGEDNLFPIGAFWPMIIVWMLLYGLFCTINKWYRWATKR